MPTVFTKKILIVIAIGIIGFVLAITINPLEFIRFNRDRQRLNDLKWLSDIIQRVEIGYPWALRGDKGVVYTSLPSNDVHCADWVSKGMLPFLSGGFSYHCASPENYRRIDGKGWLPIDLTMLASNRLKQLPIDPKNGKLGKDPNTGETTLHFYQYISGSFAVASKLESLHGFKERQNMMGIYAATVVSNQINPQSSPLARLLPVLPFGRGIAIGTAAHQLIKSLPKVEHEIVRTRMRLLVESAAVQYSIAGNNTFPFHKIVNGAMEKLLPSIAPPSPVKTPISSDAPSQKISDSLPINRVMPTLPNKAIGYKKQKEKEGSQITDLAIPPKSKSEPIPKQKLKTPTSEKATPFNSTLSAAQKFKLLQRCYYDLSPKQRKEWLNRILNS